MTALARTPNENLRPERFLIGPRTYPAFRWMCQMTLLGLAAGCAIWFAWPLAGFLFREGFGGPQSAAVVSFIVADLVHRIVGQSVLVVTEFVRSALATLGVLMMAFAVVERCTPRDAAEPAASGRRPQP